MLAATSATVIALAVSCSSEPPAARPADSYASIEELARELEEAELCEEFVDESHRTKNFEFGTCWPPRADRDTADFVLLKRYPKAEQRERWKRAHSNGCDGPMVYGPNWSIGPVFSESDEVLEAVGGEVVGWRESRPGGC